MAKLIKELQLEYYFDVSYYIITLVQHIWPQLLCGVSAKNVKQRELQRKALSQPQADECKKKNLGLHLYCFDYSHAK